MIKETVIVHMRQSCLQADGRQRALHDALRPEASAERTRSAASSAIAIPHAFALVRPGTFAPEQIDAVNGMQHGIAVDAVIPGVAALHGIDGAAEVALVVQYVV